MNVIDLLTFVAVLIIGFKGLRKGLVKEFLEACSAVLGLVIAYHTYDQWGTTVTLATGIPVDVTRPVIFAAVAIAATAIGFLVASYVAQVAPEVGWFRTFNGIGGMAFGTCKGLFYAVLVVLLLAQAPFASVATALDGSAFGRAIYRLMPEVFRRIEILL